LLIADGWNKLRLEQDDNQQPTTSNQQPATSNQQSTNFSLNFSKNTPANPLPLHPQFTECIFLS
jgi:hypothetical protein